MKLSHDHPVITGDDYPELVHDALIGSINLLETDRLDVGLEPSDWRRVVQPAARSLNDRFMLHIPSHHHRPFGAEVRLGLDTEQLEEVLTAYGLYYAREERVQNQVEELLMGVNGLQAQLKARESQQLIDEQ